MSNEEYERLNDYLNICFKWLEKNEPFFINNLYFLARLSDMYSKVASKYEITLKMKQNKLTYEDVYLLGREIIETIDKNYLKYYDEIISTGKLDFNYENEINGSIYIRNNQIININRDFNYSDVGSLVHEFIHYMNLKDGWNNEFGNALCEFFSIYFEEYAKQYMIDKGVNEEELDYKFRYIDTKSVSNKYNWYALILIAYNESGNIDENTYQFLKDYCCDTSKEKFDEECKKSLEYLDNIYKEYQMEIMYENEYDEEELAFKLCRFLTNYRYILGTILTFVAQKKCDFDKVVYLCNNVNKKEFQNKSFYDLLEIINIKLNEMTYNELENIIDEAYSKKFQTKVKNG